MSLFNPMPFDLEEYKRNIFGYSTKEKEQFAPPKIASIDGTNEHINSLFDIDNYKQKTKIPLANAKVKEPKGNEKPDTSLYDEIYNDSMKSIEQQKKYNLFKTISEAGLTAGSMLGNILAKRPERIPAPIVVPPTYESTLEENKNLIDRNMAGSLAAGIKMAQETGQLHLIPSMIANMQSGQNTAYNQLAQNEITQKNAQAVANAEAANKNSELDYAATLQDAEMMDKINATRSELIAKMGKSLFITIPNTYVENNANLIDQGNKMKMYKQYLEDGGKYSYEDFAIMMGWMEYKTPKTNTTTTETNPQ